MITKEYKYLNRIKTIKETWDEKKIATQIECVRLD